MEIKILFSIVTITRNNRAGLAKTAASIKNQSCKDFSWIIIDGDSGDGSQDDFKNYADLALIVSEPDEGIYDAMNKGITLADGDYTLFLNAGDTLASPDTLEKIKEAMSAHYPDFMYGDALEETSSKHTIFKPARPHTTITQGMFTHHQAMLYKTQKLADYRFNPHFTIAADYDLTFRFLEDGANTLYIPHPVCLFEKDGISQRAAKVGRQEQFEAKRHKIPLLQNILIYIRQTLSQFVKDAAPSLYWKLRGASWSHPQSSGNT
ncbi:MAG: glycosyltransferase family 2 protein [Pseudobdellovibrionaceae bacterium]